MHRLSAASVPCSSPLRPFDFLRRFGGAASLLLAPNGKESCSATCVTADRAENARSGASFTLRDVFPPMSTPSRPQSKTLRSDDDEQRNFEFEENTIEQTAVAWPRSTSVLGALADFSSGAESVRRKGQTSIVVFAEANTLESDAIARVSTPISAERKTWRTHRVY